MTSAQSPAGDSSADVDTVRTLVIAATQRLLGDTIAVPDEQWRAASRLPGWTRGHVATHVARQADALVRQIQGAISGTPTSMYPDPGQREAEIEAGAGRSGLDLQIDLDTSAGALSEIFDTVAAEAAWERRTELRGGIEVPLRLLPLARLSEVVLHHVDLDVGFALDDVDEATAGWLLEWVAFRVRPRPDFPRVHATTDGGTSLTVGSQGGPVEVRGTSPRVLGWLTSRGSGDTLSGADGVRLPAF